MDRWRIVLRQMETCRSRWQGLDLIHPLHHANMSCERGRNRCNHDVQDDSTRETCYSHLELLTPVRLITHARLLDGATLHNSLISAQQHIATHCNLLLGLPRATRLFLTGHTRDGRGNGRLPCRDVLQICVRRKCLTSAFMNR